MNASIKSDEMDAQSQVEKIIAAHLTKRGEPELEAGALVWVEPDYIYVQDGNAPTILKIFKENDFSMVFDEKRISFVFDHSVLVSDTKMADRMKEAYSFGKQIGVDIQTKGAGISHVIAAENRWFKPGSLVLGSDSHTCIGGAYGALGLGMGASDIAAAMVTGMTWLKVPETVNLVLNGEPGKFVRPRDIMLQLLNNFDTKKFLYKSVEITGEYVKNLSEDDAASMASLGVELGAKCVFLERPNIQITPLEANETISVDIEQFSPVISAPHLPGNIKPINEYAGIEIDYIFIGSCTNGRLKDLHEVADYLKDKKVLPGVQLVVTPASKEIYQHALQDGTVLSLVSSGALITPPGCGSCVGTQGPLPADGDRILSTMNRNFRGRMGNPNSEIYLSSPLVAAATATLGHIPCESDLICN